MVTLSDLARSTRTLKRANPAEVDMIETLAVICESRTDTLSADRPPAMGT